MGKESRTIYPGGLKKEFNSKFHVGSRVRYETHEKGRRTHRPKRYEYDNKDEDNNLNW